MYDATMQPTFSYAQAHPDFAALRFIPDALAVHASMSRQPTSGSVLSFGTPSSTCRPHVPRRVLQLHLPSSSLTIFAFAQGWRLDTLFFTHTPILVGDDFSGSFTVRFRCNLSICWLPYRSRPELLPAYGNFYFRASNETGHPYFIAGYHYDGN